MNKIVKMFMKVGPIKRNFIKIHDKKKEKVMQHLILLTSDSKYRRHRPTLMLTWSTLLSNTWHCVSQ